MTQRILPPLPMLEATETQPSRALVRWIVTLVCCTTTLSVALLPVFGQAMSLVLAAAGVIPFLLVYATALVVNHRGSPARAASIFVWGTFICQSGVLWVVPDFFSQTIISFVNVTLCAGFMRGRRSALKVGGATLIVVTAAHILTVQGLAPGPAVPASPGGVFISILCTLAATAGFVYIGVRFTSESLRRSRASQAEAERALGALAAVSDREAERAARAERLATMARRVLALQDADAIAKEVAVAVAEALGHGSALVLDRRGRVLATAGAGSDSALPQDHLFGGLVHASRALTQDEIVQVAAALGVEAEGAGRVWTSVDDHVSLVVVGRADAMGRSETEWQLDAAWHVLLSSFHRTHVQHALSQSQRMDALGRLSAGIAHDFNNLLTSILGGAELAATRVKGDPKAEKYIDSLREAAERAAGLTTKLMAFTASASQGPRRLEAVALVEGLLPVFRSSIPERIQLDVALPDERVWIDVDAVDLERALLNLVVNARDALENRGMIEVGVDVRGPEPGVSADEQVVIWVQDNGPGIAAELQSMVFEPFFSTRRERGASGLGLSIVYGVVQSMGGEVLLFSEPEDGTRIELVFARQDVGSEPEEPEPSDARAQAAGRILVVEDDPDVRDTICEMLEVGGYTVEIAADGHEALRLIEAGEEFALVLSDVVMPEMGGFELARRIRQRAHPPVVALVSGYAPTAAGNEFDESIALIGKPFTLKRLLDFVGRLVA